jgi:hypothetical protein
MSADFDPEYDLPPDGARVTYAGVLYRFDASRFPTGMWVDPDGRVGRPFSEGGKVLARLWVQRDTED